MNKRYAAALGVAAAAVLVAGALLRPKHHPPAKQTAAPAEPAPVRGSEMRQMSDFLQGRAQTAARHLVWVASAQATGVQWSDGQIVTLGETPSIVRTAFVTTPGQLQPVTLSPLTRFTQGGWIVIAARNAEGSLVNISGLLGGVAPAKCGSAEVQRLLFNVPLETAYAGAGVFGMSGALLGIVVRCGTEWTAITHDSVQRLLQTQLGPDAVAWHEFGVRSREPSESEAKLLRLREKGVFVGEVRRASTAANMGIRPGDLLLIADANDLLSVRDEVELIRNGRMTRLQVSPPFSLQDPQEGAVLTSVKPGTDLAEAGLQPGDRILNPEALRSRRPVWIIYERDDRQIGVLLP